MSTEAADSLFQLLAKSMAPGDRIAYWELYIPRHPSQSLSDQLVYLKQLSEELTMEDRVFHYSAFKVLEVK